MEDESYEEYEELTEEEEGEMMIYSVTAGPFLQSNGLWVLNTRYFMSESGEMGEGVINCKTEKMAKMVRKHFRESVDPLTNEKLTEIFNESKKETIH